MRVVAAAVWWLLEASAQNATTMTSCTATGHEARLAPQRQSASSLTAGGGPAAGGQVAEGRAVDEVDARVAGGADGAVRGRGPAGDGVAAAGAPGARAADAAVGGGGQILFPRRHGRRRQRVFGEPAGDARRAAIE